MAETFGSLGDKLTIVNLKQYHTAYCVALRYGVVYMDLCDGD